MRALGERRGGRAQSCTAPPSAPMRCSSGEGPKIGVITTRGFRDVLEMRRRDRPPDLGPVGRLHADCRPRPAPRGRRAHARRRQRTDAGRCRRGARRRADLARARRAGARHLLHQRLCQSRERGARAGGRPCGVAERARLRLARDSARDPRVRAYLDHRAQRLSAAGGRRLSRTLDGALASSVSPDSSTSCSRMAA